LIRESPGDRSKTQIREGVTSIVYERPIATSTFILARSGEHSDMVLPRDALTLVPHRLTTTSNGANSKTYLAFKLGPDLNQNPELRPREMRSRLGLYYSQPHEKYMPLYRAREIAKEKIWGDEAKTYKKLPAYCELLQTTDEDSYVILKKHPLTRRFQALFIALGSLYYAIQTVRPFFAFDGTHVRTKYNLTLLIAIGIDGEGHTLPLCWTIVPKENNHWWEWFIYHFKEVFGEILWTESIVIGP